MKGEQNDPCENLSERIIPEEERNGHRATNAEATKAQKVITKITQKQVRPQLMLVKHTKHQHCSRHSQQPSFYHTVIIHVVVPLSYTRRQCKRPLDGS